MPDTRSPAHTAKRSNSAPYDQGMAEVPVERRAEILRATFDVLANAPEGMAAADVISTVAERVGVTEYEAGHYQGGVRRFDQILRFQTIPSVKAAWLIKDAGVWHLSDEGRKALKEYEDAKTLYLEARKRYRAWKKGKGAGEESEDAESDEAQASVTLEEAEERAWAEIFDYLHSMPPYDFQELVAALLRSMGYHVAFISPPGPDQGLDVLAFTDPLGASGPRIKVQVKRKTDKVTSDGLKSFMAILGTQDVGIFISLGGFTSEAEKEARNQETRRISLIGRERLVRLWIEHLDKVPEADLTYLPLKPVYFLSLPG